MPRYSRYAYNLNIMLLLKSLILFGNVFHLVNMQRSDNENVLSSLVRIVIPWSKLLLEYFIVAQLVKKLSAFYTTGSSITMFTITGLCYL